MKKLLCILFSFTLFSFTSIQKNEITIYMIGDSTMANKPLYDNPERGWGQLFPRFFNDKVRIENHAVNGRSTKSFIDEGRWDSIMLKLKKGDYVFIQFGHNDEKKENPKVYAEAHTTYKQNLARFISDCRQKGAIPILCTPVVRRRFDDKGMFFDTHGDYPDVVRELAKEQHVLFIDMHQKTEKLLREYGAEGSKALFLYIKPGEYQSLPKGRIDDTHSSELGAIKNCQLAIEGIKELGIDLKNYLKNE
ncbi:MAG: rhamnogalacturonan acetylesterase [Bacteroidota bacterium]|nr:rhamnogalacturonan acetylesterase [Bacteroidota bacterium]